MTAERHRAGEANSMELAQDLVALLGGNDDDPRHIAAAWAISEGIAALKAGVPKV